MIGVGQQVGGYMVLQKLGRGGMGEVYLAQHRRVARRAAIKVLVPELSQNVTVLDRFFNEARATSLIRHPGIVEILDCDVLDGQAFIIMELLEGESLGDYLHRAGALGGDLPLLLGAAVAAASAVGAAHATGIIHRDLKPDNVYLHLPGVSDPTTVVKILDFGIAKLAQQDGGPSQTSTGVLLGTPAYMSPEQCRGAGKVDGRTDIYSLGCILYEAVCGTPPFVREGVGDLIIAHVAEIPEAPVTKVSGLPPALSALIMRMLAKKMEERPQSMEEVANLLRDTARGLGISVDTPLRPRSPVQRPVVTVEGAPTFPSRAGSSSGLSGSQGTRSPSNPTPRPHIPTPAPLAPVGSRSGSVDRGAALGGSGPLAAGIAGASGGTRVLEAQKPTTLGAAAGAVETRLPPEARKKPPWLAIAAGAVVLGGGAAVAVIFAGGGGKGRSGSHKVEKADDREIAADPGPARSAPDDKPDDKEEKTAAPPENLRPAKIAAGGTGSAAPGAGSGPAAAKSPPGEAPAPRKEPETVSIDIPGVPSGSDVSVDNRPASLPIRLPRGPESHRIVIRPPGGQPRERTVDGMRDLQIEMTFEKEKRASAGEGKPSKTKDHHTSSSSSSSSTAAAAPPHPPKAPDKPAAPGGGAIDPKKPINIDL